MAEYDFELRLDLGDQKFNDQLCERFCETGGDDAVFGISNGQAYALYTREAETQAAAVLSAIEQVTNMGLTVTGIDASTKEPLKLYNWDKAKTNENYMSGNAVVMAHNEEEARAIFRKALEAWLRENREWVFMFDDEKEEADELLAKADEDAASPIKTISETPVGIVIRGGD